MAALGDVTDSCLPYPEKVTIKLHANWGHASAQQVRRVLVDSVGEPIGLLGFVAEVLQHCDVRRAFGEAPHLPVAGTSPVSPFNEKPQLVLLFLDDAIALDALDISYEFSLLIPVRSEKPLEAWDAFCSSRIAISGRPKCMRMDAGDEWGNEIWVDSWAERRIRPQFHVVGARPWVL